MDYREIANASIAPGVYDEEMTFEPCLVRVVENPYDPGNAIIDWCLMDDIRPCPYPVERVIEMHDNVQVIILKDSKTGQTEVMWKRQLEKDDTDKLIVDMNLYDKEDWYEYQTVDVYYPLSGEGDAKLDFYPYQSEHLCYIPGYYKAETHDAVRVQVLTNTVTGKISIGWERY